MDRWRRNIEARLIARLARYEARRRRDEAHERMDFETYAKERDLALQEWANRLDELSRGAKIEYGST